MKLEGGLLVDLTLHFLVPADPSLFPRLEAAVRGGVTVVQLREKERDDRTTYTVGRELRALCRKWGVAFTVDDRLDLALALDADGLHVGGRNLPPDVVARHLPRSFLLGFSTHSLEEALAAEERFGRILDYLGFGPVFPTRSKADAGEATGVAALREVAARVRLPVVAIGGIDEDGADAVFAAGATGIAVISALLEAEDPEAKARRLRPRP
jgi:thiamine-phosphate pyrophosphorylase